MAKEIQVICHKVGIEWIYKSCYDKDCRSSPDSFHGLGRDHGLRILADIRKEFGIPVVSDFSDPSWGIATGEVCDLVQVPAYLCRQTSILRAAAKTARPVHLKKGQFMSPWNMKNSVRKIETFGNDQILLTDRGTFFGYNMLVNDMTNFPIMAKELDIQFVLMLHIQYNYRPQWAISLADSVNLFPISCVPQPLAESMPFSWRYTMILPTHYQMLTLF